MADPTPLIELPRIDSPEEPRFRWKSLADWQQPRVILRLVMIALSVALVCVSMGKGISHDEHQFVVPGYLTFQKGLVPYRDYPLFHVPYLVLLNGLIASIIPYKMAALRLLVAGAVSATMVMLTRFAWERFANLPPRWRLAGTVAVAVLFVCSQVTALTAQLIWNHGVPVCLVILGFVCQVKAFRSARPGWLHFWSGVLLATATGMRLTFLPLFAPYGLAILLQSGLSGRQKLTSAAAFSIGGLLAGLPVFLLWRLYPEQFVFGNFLYPKLSLVWRDLPFWDARTAEHVDPIAGLLNSKHPGFEGLPLRDKLRRFSELSLAGNWPVFAAFLVLGLPASLWALVRSRGRDTVVLLALLCVPFAAWGCLAPSRFNAQYSYALIPFLVLVVTIGCSALLRPGRFPVRVALLVLLSTSALIVGTDLYRAAPSPFKPGAWKGVSFHRRALDYRKLVPGPNPRILTLDPLFQIEAGMEVYPELSSGEFGWRASHLIPRAQRQTLHLICPEDLTSFAQANPPDGVLVNEKYQDNPKFIPLLEFARERGFQPVDKDKTVWLPPGGAQR